MGSKKNVMLLALAVGFSSTAAAQQFNGRWYGGLGAGVSTVEPDTSAVAGVDVTDNSSTGIRAFAGYDLAPNFSVEGYYSDLGTATLTPGTGSASPSGDREIGYQTVGVSGLYYVYNPAGGQAMTNREGLNVFAKGGIGMMDNGDNTGVTDAEYERIEDFHLALGLGGEYGMKNGFAVRADYDSYDKDAKLASLSVMKRFGGAAAKPLDVPAPDPYVAPATTLPPVDYEPIGILQTPDPVYVGTIDSDNDMVPDDRDACPRSDQGVKVDDYGCVFGGILQGVNFELDSDRLTSQARYILDGVIRELRRYPNIDVEVAAHTDNQSSNEYNIDLSQRRALSVVNYLTAGGIERNRMRPRGYGEEQPIFRNDTKEGRHKNRRVEFEILNY